MTNDKTMDTFGDLFDVDGCTFGVVAYRLNGQVKFSRI